MGQIIVQQIVSADGFAADPRGGLEMHRTVASWEEIDREAVGEFADLAHILLGRRTYEEFVRFWPTEESSAELMRDLVNSTPKTVLSSTLREAPWGDHAPAELSREDPVTLARRLAEDGDVVVWGSLTLTDALWERGAVDVLELRYVPAVLGAGRRVLPGAGAVHPLRLVGSRTFDAGLVVARWATERR